MDRNPLPSKLFEAIEVTWPAANLRSVGGFALRDGRGGGKRVSAATLERDFADADLSAASTAMQEIGQTPLWMIRGDQPELDHALALAGAEVVDPTVVLCADASRIARYDPEELTAIFCDYPVAIQSEIWAKGGIGPARLAVMARVTGARTYLLGRMNNRPVGCAFVAMHESIAMVHAVEVLADHRRIGAARAMMLVAAWWARAEGATHFACLTTKANVGAQRLYAKLGMEKVTQYHYRQIKGD